ncbi:MAG: magnesium and cobalt transport protein CorA [Proteobacteria bacterium]|nr:magnesium and cobalt transport protein CorA [Pseudomonadota bacterium]
MRGEPENMIQTIVYEHEIQRFGREIHFEDISDVVKEPRNLVWIDVEKPTEQEMQRLQQELALHPLSVEDVLHGHQRPKIDEYEGYFFVVANALRYDTANVSLELTEIDFFIGRNYVVTVHDGTCKAIDEALTRARAHPRVFEEGLGLLVYTIMDAIIDEYMPILDQLDEKIDSIEEGIFNHFEAEAINGIFRLKREMLKVRRNVGHMRDVFNILARRDQPLFSSHAVLYFQDIYDHLYRITDAIDIYRDTLTSALEAYVSLNANKLNEIMKVFGGISIILMTAALIAGIYGMNFQYMPELHWSHGYPSAMGLMVVLGLAELVIFKHKGWL